MALSALTILGYVSSTGMSVLFVAVAYGVNTFVLQKYYRFITFCIIRCQLFGCGRVKENMEGIDETIKKLEEQAEKWKKCEEGQTYDEEQKKCVDNVKDAVNDLQGCC